MAQSKAKRLAYMKNYRETLGGSYIRLIHKARARGFHFTLNFDEFTALKVAPCTYCNTTERVGIDRIDNDKGYIPGNVVSCCPECNRVRSNKYTPEQMKLIGALLKTIKES